MKLYRITYLFILLVLAALCALLIVKQAQAQSGGMSARYVSSWIVIQPGQTLSFRHELGIRPLELFVWVIVAEKTPDDVGAVITPNYDFKGGGMIRVYSVGANYIYIQNLDTTMQRIKVVAKP